MKKILIVLALVLSVNVFAQEPEKTYTRNGKEFTSTAKASTSTPGKDTGFTWKDSKGNVYPIYMSSRGSCYVVKVSKKTGKEYRQYLSKELSAEIAKEIR